MKTLLGVLGILAFGGIVYLLLRKSVNTGVAGTGGVAPQVGNAPSPTLCGTLVTLGGTGAGAYYGGPNGAALGAATGAATAKPICDMGKALLAGAKWLGAGTVTVGKTVANAGVTGARAVGSVTVNTVKNPVGTAGNVLAYGTGLKAVGAGVSALVGNTGHYIDTNAQSKLRKVATSNILGGTSVNDACALRNSSDKAWTVTSSFCQTQRQKAGL